MKCRHVDLKKEIRRERGIYIYDIGCNQTIELCPDCNLNLAGEIAKQMAIEAFLQTSCLCHDDLNLQEVENGRRQKKRKYRRKKSKD